MGLFSNTDVETTHPKGDPSCTTKVTETTEKKIAGQKVQETLSVCANDKGDVQKIDYEGKLVTGTIISNLTAYTSGNRGEVAHQETTSAHLANADGSLTKDAFVKALSGHGDLLKALEKAKVTTHHDMSSVTQDMTFVHDVPKTGPTTGVASAVR